MAKYTYKTEIVNFTAATRVNGCVNPSFETNTTSWAATDATISRETTFALFGSASLGALATSATQNSAVTYGTSSANRPAAVQGDQFTASIYARTAQQGVQVRTMRIAVVYYNASGTAITGGATVQDFQTNSRGWTRLFVTSNVAPVNTAYVGFRVNFQQSDTNANNGAYFDGALLEKTTSLKPYFDGDSTGPLPGEKDNVFTWLGTPNASASQNVCQVFGVQLPLDDVQEITVSRGRQAIQDPFRAATAVVSGRRPDLLPTIRIGDIIFITAITPALASIPIFNGVVSNFSVKYGEVASMDLFTIEAEDALAVAGRAVTTDTFSWPANISTFEAAQLACTNAGVAIQNVYNTPSGSNVSAQTLANRNVLELLNQLAATEQGRLVGLDSTAVGWVDRTAFGDAPNVITFSDVLTGELVPYNQVDFRSLADSFFTEVIVKPQGLASQSSGTESRTYTLNSFDAGTGQAKNLADYVLTTLEVNVAKPSIIGTLSEIASITPNDRALLASKDAGTGIRATLELRGFIYGLFIEGSTLTASPDQTRFSFYVVSDEALDFFVLDSATFGVLDQNKLGF